MSDSEEQSAMSDSKEIIICAHGDRCDDPCIGCDHWPTHRDNPMNQLMSKKAKTLKASLEALGHTNVRVWWERISAAMEMSGIGGGWMCRSDQINGEIEPLGSNYDRAMAHLNEPWMDVRESGPHDFSESSENSEADSS